MQMATCNRGARSSRRRFLWATLGSGVLPRAGGTQGRPERDRFGGWPGIRFEPTGFFRLENKDRWWFVTPEGNAFLGFGLNHANPGLVRRSECVAQFAKQFGIAANADASEFLAGYRNKLRADMATLGMNHLGVHSSTRELPAIARS